MTRSHRVDGRNRVRPEDSAFAGDLANWHGGVVQGHLSDLTRRVFLRDLRGLNRGGGEIIQGIDSDEMSGRSR